MGKSFSFKKEKFKDSVCRGNIELKRFNEGLGIREKEFTEIDLTISDSDFFYIENERKVIYSINKRKSPTITSIANHQISFEVFDSSNMKEIWVLQADSEDDLKDWLIGIRKCFRPSWVSSKAEICFRCQVKFNKWRTRHHCRACGTVLCNKCSKKRTILISMAYAEPVRVCEFCYKAYNSPARTSVYVEMINGQENKPTKNLEMPFDDFLLQNNNQIDWTNE